ncbi:MAG: hypothetical protein TR69_WS6001000109 [candidate division WS6 bacterium OLB20]|uniref:DUF2834 domain-containing protein n=1 Tax=candidate division WS6 bacterium OLB20 TaxID=1617426 RepID=A0A136M035_9BACT|nr:MAG: hypothetical protein TR69_WS6001000109 [candidate division WS6 bacterium OLB20]
MQINRRQLAAAVAAATWAGLILFAVVDGTGAFGTDIGFTASLQQSGLARIMFADIGVLSTLCAVWIIRTGHRLRYLFAAAALFTGSFAVLPFLSLYLLQPSKTT